MNGAIRGGMTLAFLAVLLARGHAGAAESRRHITLFNESKGRVFPIYSLADYGFEVHSHLAQSFAASNFNADVDRSILLYLGPDVPIETFLNRKECRESAERLLARGGTILFDLVSLTKTPARTNFLNAIKASIPDRANVPGATLTIAKEGAGANHPILTHPFQINPRGILAGGSFTNWGPGQLAPLRFNQDEHAAPLIIQENVLGKGKIIFSACATICSRDYGDSGFLVKNLLSYISGAAITGAVTVPVFQRYQTKAGYRVWGKNPYAAFPLEADAPEKLKTDTVALKAAINEYISGMFLVTASPETNLIFRIKAAERPAEGGRSPTGLARAETPRALPPEKITVRELMLFKDYTERWVADPMPEVTSAVAIPAGGTKVFWLTVATHGLEAGVYAGRIKITPENGTESDLVVSLAVWPIELPANNPLRFGVWDYVPCKHRTDLIGGWDNWKNYQADLADHGVNVYAAAVFNHPYPAYDKQGALTAPLDFTLFDQEIQPREKEVMFLIRTPGPRSWFGDKVCRDLGYLTPAWEKMFRAWLKEMLAHLKELGLDYDQFAFYPCDEPWQDEEINGLIRESRIIKDTDPQIKIFVTLGNRIEKNPEKIKPLSPYVDIWCPHIKFYKHFVGAEGNLFKNVLDFCQSTGKEVWSYENNARGQSYDLTAYQCYRLKPWGAYRLGLGGYGFWAYNPWKGDPWQVFAKDGEAKAQAWKDACSVVYSGPNPVPSIRWEAIREGLNDIKYLAVLKDRIENAKKKGADKQVIARAEELAQNALKEVTEEIDDPDLVYRCREKIAQAIMNLEPF